MSTDAERLAALEAYARSGARIRLEMSGGGAFSILALVQLALRHPGVPDGTAAANGRRFYEQLIDDIAPEPGPLRDLCFAGFDPKQDE